MNYYKRTTDDSNEYYMTDIDSDGRNVIITETDTYTAGFSDLTEDEIMELDVIEEMAEDAYFEVCDNINLFIRLGTHPPRPPGH
jgi:hypothetical protein